MRYLIDNDFLIPFKVLPYSKNAAKTYGVIRSQLESKGQIIGPLDLLIAAHAMSEKLILVTNNDNEFKRINGLVIENWTQIVNKKEEKNE